MIIIPDINRPTCPVPPGPADPGVWKSAAMSRIVMVHGAGNDLWGPASIKSRWFPALADGLAWHGVAIDEQDVTVAFYGDVFRPDPEDGYEPAGGPGRGHRHRRGAGPDGSTPTWTWPS